MKGFIKVDVIQKNGILIEKAIDVRYIQSFSTYFLGDNEYGTIVVWEQGTSHKYHTIEQYKQIEQMIYKATKEE